MLRAPVIVTPPAGDVITIDQAKSFLRVDGDGLDEEIGLIVAAAVEELEGLTGARLLNQTVRVGADCFADLAHLRVAPVRAVVSLVYADPAGAAQTVPADTYALEGAPFEQGVRLSPGQSWPAARAGSIAATLEVGYGEAADDVPAKLKLAAFAILRARFDKTEADVAPLIGDCRFWL